VIAMERNVQKRRRKAYSTDRVLPISQATPVLTEQLGRGWSRDSIKRKISEGAPFTWVEGDPLCPPTRAAPGNQC
jgi:hypothetical protein